MVTTATTVPTPLKIPLDVLQIDPTIDGVVTVTAVELLFNDLMQLELSLERKWDSYLEDIFVNYFKKC